MRWYRARMVRRVVQRLRRFWRPAALRGALTGASRLDDDGDRDDELRLERRSSSPGTATATGSGWASGAPTATRCTAGRSESILAHYYPAPRSDAPRPSSCACSSPDARPERRRSARRRLAASSTAPGQRAEPPGRAARPSPPRSRLDGQNARLAAHVHAGPLARRGRRGSPTAAGSCVVSNGKASRWSTSSRSSRTSRASSPRRCRRPGRSGARGAGDRGALLRARADLQTVVTASPFDLYADSRSQVYGGIAAETPAVTKAVDGDRRNASSSTAARSRRRTSRSSSGGETMSSASRQRARRCRTSSPVPDPYDTLSPYHDWGPVLLSAADAGEGARAPRRRSTTSSATLDPTGRVASATTVSHGSTVTSDRDRRCETTSGCARPGSTSACSRSHPVARARDARGTPVDARRVRSAASTDVSLEALAADGSWTTVGAVTPDADGVVQPSR